MMNFTNFSAAAAVAPIKLWNESCEGSVYVAGKNTFLEFYNDDNKAIKRSGYARSASVDSHITCARCVSGYSTATHTPTNTPTNRSSSPSNHSQSSASGFKADAMKCSSTPLNTDLQSPEFTPRQPFGYHPALSVTPLMMPLEYESAQERPAPVVVKPITKSERLASKKQDLKKFKAEDFPEEEITTLMVRGIPCSFSQENMMKIIDIAGLKGQYNFFYLPRAGNNGSNLGYAFINFVDHVSAEKFTVTFNGCPLDPSRSTKICTISAGDIQGLANLRKHFRRTAVSRGCRGPVFLKSFNAGGTQTKQ